MIQEKIKICGELHHPHFPGMNNGCFVAGTLVWTDKGPIPIEQIKVGDVVLSKPENGVGNQACKRVVNTYAHEDKAIWCFAYAHLQTNIETWAFGTAGHPVWAKGKEWTSIEMLIPGDLIEAEDGKDAIVWLVRQVLATRSNDVGFVIINDEDNGGIRFDFSDGFVKIQGEDAEFLSQFSQGEAIFKRQVFNIEVEDFHTYYIGQPGVWVHNTNCAEPQTPTVSRPLATLAASGPDITLGT